jgi:hypothetical protein
MIIKFLDENDTVMIADFISNAKPTEQILNADKIFEKIISNNNYGGFAVIEDGKIINVLFFRIIRNIKAAVLDIIWIRDGYSFIDSYGPEIYNKFLEYLTDNQIWNYYTFSEKRNSEKFEKVFARLVEKRKKYDCYIDEIIPPNHFSKHYLHFWTMMNGTLRPYETAVRQYVLKQEYRQDV